MPDNSSQKSTKAGPSDRKQLSRKFPVVGIGASAGGLEAFKIFFEKMPVDTGMAFVMIPHLDPGHKSLMVEIIARYTAMPVLQVKDGMKIESDHVYIVPPNRNLTIEGGKLTLSEISRNRGINLPVDIFFKSLAASQKERAIGVILSGTMRDGAMGLKDIKEHGGLVIAQSPETAQHDGMPQSAIDTGMVDFVLAIEDMPEAILKFISHPYIHGDSSPEDPDELNQVLAIIRARTGHDFRCYKRNTLVRRTERRMGLRQIERMGDYLKVVKNNPKELDELLKDLLIGVTGFFREEQVWEKLRNEILPSMVRNLKAEEPIRVWIPGCSTGEEAYTIALLIHDTFEKTSRHFNAQIFATDIDGEAIAVARRGVYPETIAANVPKEYLKKYFTREDDQYHVLRRIRESVVFAEQNLVGDAPFSNLNLVSCRNLLIYLNSDIQKKIIELFHFSLVEDGCLILGNSETVGYNTDLFETYSKELRIYRRIGQRIERLPVPVMGYSPRYHWDASEGRSKLTRNDVSKLMQTQLLKQFAPAAVLIDKNYEILNLFGETSRYLDLPQGDPVMELTSMAKEGLRLKLRGAIHRASQSNEIITVKDARVKRDHRYFHVTFTVSPVTERDLQDTLFLLTFQDKPLSEPEYEKPEDLSMGDENLVKQLEAELIDTREDLQNTIEELETSNEELKASNEEMMSMNEELQSSNEELETSKEELQSMNEELNTVNAELREKVQDLEKANNDIANLMNSTEVATVFLDDKMEIRRFTPTAKNLFNLIPSDVGRPIGDLAMRFNDPDLQDDSSRVMDTLHVSSKEVETHEGRWYIRRILPFRTQDKRVDGLVLTFSDVTDIKEKEKTILENEREVKEQSQILSGILEHTHMMAVLLDSDFNFVWVNRAYAETCRKDPDFFPGKNHFDMYPNDENREIFRRVVKTGEPFFTSAKPFEFPDQPERGVTYWDWSLVPVKDKAGKVYNLVFSLYEVTKQIRATQALAENEQKYRDLVENANSAIIRWDVDGKITFFNEYAENFFGYAEEDVLGKEVSILLPDTDLSGKDLTGLVQEIVTHPEKYSNSINENILKDGTRVWMAWTNKPVLDKNGKVIEILAVGSDITALKTAEIALAKEESEKSLILENANEIIAYHDTDHNLIWANQAYLTATNLPLSELQGKKCFHCWGLDKHCKGCPVSLAIETGMPQSGELTPENQEHWPYNQGYWHVRSAPVRDKEGNIIGAIEMAHDITEEKKAEKKLRVLAHFPGENPNPVMRCTVEGDILYTNNPAQSWLINQGWNSGEPLPAVFLDLVKSASEKNHPMKAEITFRTDQTYNVVATRPPGEEYVNIYGTDITDRKAAETALQKAHDGLEKKVNERTAELEWRNRELQEFAYVASHDLQEPLRKIKLFEEMLEKELEKGLTDQGRDYLKRMTSAADRMQKLVKALLAYSRTSEKTNPFERVDLKSVADVIARDLLPEDIELVPVFEIGDLPVIDADPVQMHQLLQNLMANAIHYHKEGLVPVVKISSQILGRTCELIIEDNGIGFDMAYVDKIFLPFERLHPRDKYHGTGMGLAICRKIAERHGGSIAARSTPGEGATFIITLPMRQTNEPG